MSAVIGAIVLAAGSSSRMGRSKAMLTIGTRGRTFLDAITETLDAAGVLAVRIVGTPGSEPLPPRGVTNPNPGAGMLSSVQCGLRALPENLDAVLVWPVDHPLVERETVVAMIAAFRIGDSPIVVPTHGGRRGHPVLFAARVFPELHAADPSCGARAIVHAHDDRLELAVEDSGVIADIDTPDDYARHFNVRAC